MPSSTTSSSVSALSAVHTGLCVLEGIATVLCLAAAVLHWGEPGLFPLPSTSLLAGFGATVLGSFAGLNLAIGICLRRRLFIPTLIAALAKAVWLAPWLLLLFVAPVAGLVCLAMMLLTLWVAVLSFREVRRGT